jgi:hypothetical protein
MILYKKLIKTRYLISGIDTDKYKYPIGSGRVTFSTKQSYFKAITASFIEIKTDKFTKKVRFAGSCICNGNFIYSLYIFLVCISSYRYKWTRTSKNRYVPCALCNKDITSVAMWYERSLIVILSYYIANPDAFSFRAAVSPR